MGESKKDALRVNFDKRLKLEFHGTKVTSDAGLLAYRELDEALGLTTMIESDFYDNRKGKNTQHNIIALLRQSIYSRLAGYEDTNDAERLSVDPAIRQVVGGRAKERTAASTSLMGRFETEILTQPQNLELLMGVPGIWVDKVHHRKRIKEIILDMDSSVSPTYGNQEGSAYNGYFGCTCYHPIFCFNQFGDIERALLRNGNVHSADDWQSVLEPIVERYRGYDIVRFFRGDAAFAGPNVYPYLEAEGYFYAIRLIGNAILRDKIEHLMTRPVGRPSKKPIVLYHSFQYRAASCNDDIATKFKQFCQHHAQKISSQVMGVKIDPVYNLSRVCRLMGTVNGKGQAVPERPHRRAYFVTEPILQGRSMALHYMILNTEVEKPNRAIEPLPKGIRCDLQKLEKCEFIQWCRRYPTLVTEPLWFGLISNLAYLEEGIELIHEISALDKFRYDYSDTQRLIQRVIDTGYKPVCCKTLISEALTCPGRGRFNCSRISRCPAKAPMYLATLYTIYER